MGEPVDRLVKRLYDETGGDIEAVVHQTGLTAKRVIEIVSGGKGLVYPSKEFHRTMEVKRERRKGS